MKSMQENGFIIPQPLAYHKFVSNYALQTNATESNQAKNFSLYVGELKDVTEKLLWSIFLAYGYVISIKICRDFHTNISLGYAYVNYRTAQEAEKAMECLNFSLIDGKPCRIMWSDRDASRRMFGSGYLIIKNLDAVIDVKSLFKAFSSFGTILACKIVLNDDGISKGYGFIQYSNEEDALNAQNRSNGVIFENKKLTVTKFIPKNERKDAKTVNPNKYTNVFVKNFTKNWTDNILRAHFEIYGEIASCVVQKNENGQSLCYGFVNFAKYESAERAVLEMNDFIIEGGNKISVCRAMKKLERKSFLNKQYENKKNEMIKSCRNTNLYVKNFDENLTDYMLKELFQEFGEITSAKIIKDEHNRSRCFGFVCFSKPENAETASCKMSTKIINGSRLYVSYAQTKEERARFIQQKNINMTSRHPLMLPRAIPVMYGPPIGFPYCATIPFPRYKTSKQMYKNRENNQEYNSPNYKIHSKNSDQFNKSENSGIYYINNKPKNHQNNSRGNSSKYGRRANARKALCVTKNFNIDINKGYANNKNNKKAVYVQTTDNNYELIAKKNDFINPIFSMVETFVSENNYDNKIFPK